MFKPVTKVTEAVKTAIVGKPDRTDPDKPQQSLLQAIEQLRKEQPKPVKGFNYKTDIRDHMLDDIRNIPSMTFKEAYEFGRQAYSAYHSREQFLKNPDQKVDKQRFLDGLYKLNKGIDRLDTSDQFYIKYMMGADEAHAQIKYAKRAKKKEKPPKFTSQLAITGLKKEETGDKQGDVSESRLPGIEISSQQQPNPKDWFTAKRLYQN